MKFHLVGIGSDLFLFDLDTADIAYREIHAPMYEPQNCGQSIDLLATVMAPVAAVLVAWLNTRPTRKAIVRTKDDVVIHVEGRSVKEVESLLKSAQSIMVMDTKPKKKKKP
jgi:hypothetical protein